MVIVISSSRSTEDIAEHVLGKNSRLHISTETFPASLLSPKLFRIFFISSLKNSDDLFQSSTPNSRIFTLFPNFPQQNLFLVVNTEYTYFSPFPPHPIFITAKTPFHHCTFRSSHVVHHCTLKHALGYSKKNTLGGIVGFPIILGAVLGFITGKDSILGGFEPKTQNQ